MRPQQEVQLQEILDIAYLDFEKGLNIHAFFKTHDHTLGEDLVQATFMKTWAYLLREGKIDFMKAFLYHVLNNLIIDEYRKRKTTSLDLLFEKGFEPSIDDSQRLFDSIDGMTATLLLQKLSETYREVMDMRYVKNMSLQEISDTTKKTKNTVSVQLHRGLKQLKILYQAG